MSSTARKIAVAVTSALVTAAGFAAPSASSAVREPDPSSTRVERLPVANGSFEEGLAGWRVADRGDHLGRSRTARDGRWSAAVSPGGNGIAVLRARRPVVGATAEGDRYRVSAWVRTPSPAATVRLRLVGTTATATLRKPAPRRASMRRGVRSWQQVELSYVAPRAGRPLRLELQVRAPGRGFSRVLVDDVQVELRREGNPAPPATWLGGASGVGVADGSFAAWRGSPVAIAGTWNDNPASQVDQWTVRSGFEYGDWQGDLDVAVGGIWKDRGESWSAAAGGAYDARWRAALTNLVSAWGTRPGTLYIRFAHEFNGDWYPWSVTAREAADFTRAWRRFRTLQREIAPRHRLVFCPNADTARSTGLDWRDAFPGADQVDVVSVDYYNQYPFTATASAFSASLTSSDGWGAPRGLERFRAFAEAVGRPFAISEWSSNADMGDSPSFVRGLHAWISEHAGTGPGQVIYDIQFNAPYGDGQFQLFPTTRQADAATAYRDLW